MASPRPGAARDGPGFLSKEDALARKKELEEELSACALGQYWVRVSRHLATGWLRLFRPPPYVPPPLTWLIYVLQFFAGGLVAGVAVGVVKKSMWPLVLSGASGSVADYLYARGTKCKDITAALEQFKTVYRVRD